MICPQSMPLPCLQISCRSEYSEVQGSCSLLSVCQGESDQACIMLTRLAGEVSCCYAQEEHAKHARGKGLACVWTGRFTFKLPRGFQRNISPMQTPILHGSAMPLAFLVSRLFNRFKQLQQACRKMHCLLQRARRNIH